MNDVIDKAAALQRLDGDMELLRELVELFLKEASPMLAAARGALARRDAQALQQTAHSLKGAAGNLAATAVFEAAKRLEFMGREGDWTHADAACSVWEQEVARLEQGLASLFEPGG